MKINTKWTLVAVGVLALMAEQANEATAQQFSIPWYTIDSGGGYASGGNFELEGTIGQHDAGPTMTGGQFAVTGGFWVGGESQEPGVITPGSFQVTRGTYASGRLGDLATSDNSDLSIRRAINDIQSRTEFEVKSISPLANPASLEFTLEGAVFARSQVTQTIELYDYVASSWELLDSRNANRFSDTTVTVPATGNLSRFVEAGTMCMEARIRYRSANPRQQFSSNTDRTVWTVGQ